MSNVKRVFVEKKPEFDVAAKALRHEIRHYLGIRNPRLHTDEVLIALSMCAATDENAQIALNQLSKLKGCQVHTSVMLSDVDITIFKKLGVNLTSEPVYEQQRIYH